MRTVAVLIDAENVHASFGNKIFSYANSLGNVTAKEIYGVASALGLWVEPVLKYAIHSNLTIKASKFKNTSDISLVIGAMDLLLEGKVDTVIIVSSDSDFSTLSVRLRSSGLEVIGMGTEKANPLWRTACTSFIVLSSVSQQPKSVPVQVVKPVEPVPSPAVGVQIPEGNATIIPPVTKTIAVQTPDKISKPVSEQEQKTSDVKKQATPVIALPEPVKTTFNSAVIQPKQVRPRAAVTHSDRTAAIRDFITKHLEMNGGKMPIPNIFHVLNNLPDYHVDQQGSKRKPLNYLMWMFSDTFAFENGMIMFPELSKRGKLKIEQQSDTTQKGENADGMTQTAIVSPELSEAGTTEPQTPSAGIGKSDSVGKQTASPIAGQNAQEIHSTKVLNGSNVSAGESGTNGKAAKVMGNLKPEQTKKDSDGLKAEYRSGMKTGRTAEQGVILPRSDSLSNPGLSKEDVLKGLQGIQTTAETVGKTVKAEGLPAGTEHVEATEEPDSVKKAADSVTGQTVDQTKPEPKKDSLSTATETKVTEKPSEKTAPAQAEKPVNAAPEQEAIRSAAVVKEPEKPSEKAAPVQTVNPMKSVAEQAQTEKVAAKKEPEKPSEKTAPVQTEKPVNAAPEQEAIRSAAVVKEAEKPSEKTAPAQTEKTVKTAPEQAAARPAAVVKEPEKPSEKAAPVQTVNPMKSVAEQAQTEKVSAKKETENSSEKAAPVQAEKPVKIEPKQAPTSPVAAEKDAEKTPEKAAPVQPAKPVKSVTEQAQVEKAAAEKETEKPSEKAAPVQAEKPVNTAAEQVQTEAASAEKAGDQRPEGNPKAKPEKQTATGLGNPSGNTNSQGESDKRAQNKGGNRAGSARKKQSEPHGNKKTSAEDRTKDGQKNAGQKAADRNAQGQRSAEDSGKQKVKSKQKQTATSEHTGPQNDQKENNSKTASKPQNNEKNPVLESISLGNIGIQTKQVKILMERGYQTLADVAQVSDRDLLRIKGIGQATVDQIRVSITKAIGK